MSSTDARTVDVLDVSDLRFAGGTSHSIAEEVKAQHAAGYSTGLVHVNGPLVAKVCPINPQITNEVELGHAELLVRRDPIRAGVVVIRHPAVLQDAARQLPEIEADHVVIVANAAPHDIDGHEHYQPELVSEVARRQFGPEPLWAPIGPQVRAAIGSRVPQGSLLDSDWVNVIDVDAWAVERDGWHDDRPVVGRHSRSSPQKWPSDAETLRAVYPVDGSWIVRILGGAEPAEALLGELPPTWEVHDFGAMSPHEFLSGLDFFVYYHDPKWVEAFGRTILEAVASGIPAVIPPHFESLFGPAAVYAEPRDVRRVVDDLFADRAAYDAHVAQAKQQVRSRFGYEAHITRLTQLIGAPAAGAEASPPAVEASSPYTGTPVTAVEASTGADTEGSGGQASSVFADVPGVPPDTAAPRALFISSNGSGMGHLTRLLSYASRADTELEPYFLSLSQAAAVVETFGYQYEYLPSMTATGLAPGRWHAYFAATVSQAIERIRPSVVVFDGTWPYEGIPAVRQAFPDVRWVWSRRGMWKAGQGADRLVKSEWFDLVMEPGDFAASEDRGATAKAEAARLGPVTLLDLDQLDDRATARAELGLDPDAPMALVSLGAGNINDTSGDVGASIAALWSLGVQVCVTRPEIAAGGGGHRDVHVVRRFPLSRHYRAFDLAISACGYNSFHELLRFRVPTLFVPNRATALDDQEARARFAAEQGLGHQLPAVTVDAAKPLLADLLSHGSDMLARLRELDPGNGAAEGAARVVRLAG
ncbi:glycosyl transferase [Phytoactinopolyspora alkaliphila]|uniref:Glycosyl transferase n=1 Tax=Phytoactinopolyspora alkaliphila TaxID=1783498 RepID=A0A6N9YQF1_9ACTN|nr:glycosyltransferase [Phytoactinopolyspora alkaliphila]NED97160.1 glycosyl transferase [Phytoactinopolyspora alkaliphila]